MAAQKGNPAALGGKAFLRFGSGAPAQATASGKSLLHLPGGRSIL